ncbi:MAG: hypothetical protein JSV91_09805 [Phycisphaerales bacterium]|nr:MAG: hypothetical protein JSV91_09805 [Phycisphaerales bacterium]
MKTNPLLAWLVCALALDAATGSPQDNGPTTADCAAVAAAVQKSLVRVEYTLQFDKSEAPYGGMWRTRCPNCGQYHSTGLEQFIDEERPAEKAGFLLSASRVLTQDPRIAPRFIKRIDVRYGDASSPAIPVAYAVDQNGLILELARPLTGAAPLQFQADREGPYFTVTYAPLNGYWTTDVQSLPSKVTTLDTGERFIAVPSGCLVVDAAGRAVGLSLKDEIPTDDSWKGSPGEWRLLGVDRMNRMLSAVEEQADRTLPRVALSFRSPKKDIADRYYGGYWGDDEADETERNVAGVMIDGKTVLVLAGLKPKVTARLERIRVYPAEGEAVEASFAGSLRDYGGFVAELEEPVTAPAPFSTDDIRDFRNTLLMSAEIRVQGESRIGYFNHDWLTGFNLAWKEQIYPEIAGNAVSTFLFSTDGRLIALPVARRKKVSVEEEWDDSQPVLTATKYLRAVLDDLPEHIDPDNVPLTEAEENRLAWMGVELQALDRDLARVNDISDETNDGETGAIVVYVYPNSPAETAGLQMGDILLRLHVEGHPRPLDVEAGDSDIWAYRGGFPWDYLDELPEESFDQVPPPWPTAENSLNRKLTDLGFGTAYAAEVFRGGEILRLDFEVTESPSHYNSAARYEDEAIGITVRDLTFEVRRYFQQGADEPAVVISKIKPGSKGSVGGLKPYERITHVNDQPVMNVGDFEELVSGQTELRLAVKRMTRGRIVKLKLDASGDESEDAAPAAGGEDDTESPEGGASDQS